MICSDYTDLKVFIVIMAIATIVIVYFTMHMYDD